MKSKQFNASKRVPVGVKGYDEIAEMALERAPTTLSWLRRECRDSTRVSIKFRTLARLIL